MAFTDENRQELADKGYTVIPDVLSQTECQGYIRQYQQWLSTNFSQGEFPLSAHSLVQRYAIGHLEPSWRVRLKSRDVFAQLWGTDRLLSSVDAVAIGRPPEEGEEWFQREEETDGWLHLDQTARRQGLHAYQGAVYLEAADHDDWTFEVVEKSHSLFDEYYDTNSEQQKRALFRGHMKAREEHLDWMRARGCVQRRVPVPSGGMVLWDSRLIHANARPRKGRAHPGRWRWVVFTCMAPACWATQKALALKRQAYDNLQMTTHWPCDDVGLMSTTLPSYAAKELRPLDSLPEVARGVVAKRLAGALAYPELSTAQGRATERSLVEQRPRWHPDFLPDELGESKRNGGAWGWWWRVAARVGGGGGGRGGGGGLVVVVVVVVTALLLAVVIKCVPALLSPSFQWE
ncbi:uncharacterized protein LOC143287275 [Babylonia areolata]|uniref:uncharacterized protein LOC143287275 n=1 Tax=Babylonia areolata TaxID=304850 RepID=UPI003FD67149